ncbi:MAG: PIN domain protein [uncultured Sulfurovum sp.]|uniref:PIN domain protein n=1 Tax=uncultured Sulfurovum sp. TaxID=269237 RepID=A0A6S6UHK0_9BACT|nr:MAG: PIN domain protein [uncultured Sulfurovum sp.]
MESKIYVDTNVFIDLMDSTRPFAVGSMALIRASIVDGKMLYINSDTVTNACYIMSRKKAYTEKELLVLMQKIVSLFSVVGVKDKEVMKSLSICADEGTKFRDYEDALQYVCAKKVEADLIVTNDKGFVGLDIELRGTKL